MISSRRTGRDSLLFVYGTLRPFVDIPMAKWLRRAARYMGPATTRGRLYDLGAYPGMRAARGRGEFVAGDLYRVSRRRRFGACSTATSAARAANRGSCALGVSCASRAARATRPGFIGTATPSSVRRESRAVTIACTDHARAR